MRGDAVLTLTALAELALAEAAAEADTIRGAATDRAQQLLAAAQAQAGELIAARGAAAERLAELEHQERIAQARSRAGAIVLEARRSVLDDATEALREAARRLPEDPRYAQLVDRLSEDAQRRLGEGEPVQITAAAGGGVIVQTATRLIDHSLGAQLERCLRTMPSELERLWR